MELAEAPSPQQNDYPAMFRDNIIRSIDYVLARAQETEYALPHDERILAMHNLSYALKLPQAWPAVRTLLVTIAPYMKQAGHRDEWIPYLEQGVALSRGLGDAQTEAELRLQLGVLYQRRSKYKQARLHLEASCQGFERLTAPQKQAHALNRLAYVARMERRFDEATRLVETIQQALVAEDEEQAFGYYVLGLVALDRREWPQAVDYSRQAFELWAAVDNRRMMGRSLLCQGVALQRMKQYPESITVNDQALTLFEMTHNAFFKAVAQMNLGIVYDLLARPHQALQLYECAKEIFRQVQDQYHLALVTHNMGLSYRQLGQWAEAKRAYQQSLALKRNLGNIALVVDTLDELGLVCQAEGDLIEARTTFQEALTWLAQMEGEAPYDHFFEMVSDHLQAVNQQIGGRR